MSTLHDNTNAEDFLVIPEHVPLEQARKDIIYGTEQPFLDDRETFSEWAMVAAFTHYRVGQRVSCDEFAKTLIECQTQQGLNKLVELGIIEAVWNAEKQFVGYKAK